MSKVVRIESSCLFMPLYGEAYDAYDVVVYNSGTKKRTLIVEKVDMRKAKRIAARLRKVLR